MHQCGGEAIYVGIYRHQRRHVGRFVERVGAVALAEVVAVGVRTGWNQAAEVVYTHGVVVLRALDACAMVLLLYIDVVVVVQVWLLFGGNESVAQHLAPSVCAVLCQVGDGIDIVLIPCLPVVILARFFVLAA